VSCTIASIAEPWPWSSPRSSTAGRTCCGGCRLGGAGGGRRLLQLLLWLAALSLERLAVFGLAARLETVHPRPAGALLRRAGVPYRSLEIHHGGTLRGGGWGTCLMFMCRGGLGAGRVGGLGGNEA